MPVHGPELVLPEVVEEEDLEGIATEVAMEIVREVDMTEAEAMVTEIEVDMVVTEGVTEVDSVALAATMMLLLLLTLLPRDPS
jgi:hypothetical protein